MSEPVAARPWLIVAGDFTSLGGMDRANLALASYLARRAGAEIHLVAHRVSEALSMRPCINVHPVPRPWGKHLLGAPGLAIVGRRWARRLARGGARVVVNGGNCRWGDVNWVHYVHAAWMPEDDECGFQRLKSRVARLAALRDERVSLGLARVVLANSERTRRDVVERLGVDPERVHTIYLGSDPERFRPPGADERAEARAALGWSAADAQPAFVFVGALGDRRKGFDTLLAAWRRLSREPSWDARLVVVGSGAALESWRQAAHDLGDSIVFLGFRGDVPRILWACDALVSPSRYEPYGLNAQEAVCSGLPAVVSQCSGVAERYPEALTELLLPDPDDPADLAERLRRVRERLGSPWPELASFAEGLRAYTWDRMAEQFVRRVEAE